VVKRSSEAFKAFRYLSTLAHTILIRHNLPKSTETRNIPCISCKDLCTLCHLDLLLHYLYGTAIMRSFPHTTWGACATFDFIR
jgi:hypothetical protein